MTLTLIYEHPKILLGMKKRGFGEGRWNGFGGKVNPEESIEEAAKREIKEEINVQVSELEKIGMLDFEFQERPHEILEVHFFQAKRYHGTPMESEEMLPQWFHVDDIPYHEMWPDDRFWIPLFLQGKYFGGRVYFKDKDNILKNEIKVIDKYQNE